MDGMPLAIEVSGTHYEMGLQHGEQVRHLRPLILKEIENCFTKLESYGQDREFDSLVEETAGLLRKKDEPLIEMLRGQAEALEIDSDVLLRYNLVSYLKDYFTTRPDPSEEGCSTWAASGSATADCNPLLVKNRDNNPKLLPLQLIVTATPETGYRHIYVSSAARIGVASSGMNEKGLAVADTHVCSSDIGPGLPDYSLMMRILEQHDTVRSALEYLSSVPLMGRNNLILTDATGDMAVVELGYSGLEVIEAKDNLVANTNHFVSPRLRESFVDSALPHARGNTFRRYELLRKELEANRRSIDIAFAKRLMATHAGPLESICRHPTQPEQSATLSAIIYQPAARTVQFCHGYPCEGGYQTFSF